MQTCDFLNLTEITILPVIKLQHCYSLLSFNHNEPKFYSNSFKFKESILMKIYHNPRCSKSRQTLKIMEDHGVKPEIIKYLKDIPSKSALKLLIEKLGITPEELVRKTEKVYKEKYRGKDLSDDEWIEAMVEHPKLIQRPIVVDGDKAVLGRPPENVEALLS